MTKVSKTAIKTKVSTQTAIMVGVVALAAFGIAAYGYGFGFGVKPSVIQNVRTRQLLLSERRRWYHLVSHLNIFGHILVRDLLTQ